MPLRPQGQAVSHAYMPPTRVTIDAVSGARAPAIQIRSVAFGKLLSASFLGTGAPPMSESICAAWMNQFTRRVLCFLLLGFGHAQVSL